MEEDARLKAFYDFNTLKIQYKEEGYIVGAAIAVGEAIIRCKGEEIEFTLGDTLGEEIEFTLGDTLGEEIEFILREMNSEVIKNFLNLLNELNISELDTLASEFKLNQKEIEALKELM